MIRQNRHQASWIAQESRTIIIVAILITALVGFEIFNYDTTKFALHNLLGDLQFWGMEWAAILAFAFCGIDFAGLIRMLTPEQGIDEPKEIWLLTGAWLLGATMNAVMTWYAISIVLVNRSVGTQVMTQEDVVFYAPIFVAALVWLTRILFIGSLSFTSDRLIHGVHVRPVPATSRRRPLHAPVRETSVSRNTSIESFHEDFS